MFLIRFIREIFSLKTSFGIESERIRVLMPFVLCIYIKEK